MIFIANTLNAYSTNIGHYMNMNQNVALKNEIALKKTQNILLHCDKVVCLFARVCQFSAMFSDVFIPVQLCS